MSPSIPDGTAIVVELTDDWRVGDRVLALVDGQPHLKRLARYGTGYILVPDDGDEAIAVDDRVDVRGVAIGKFEWF